MSGWWMHSLYDTFGGAANGGATAVVAWIFWIIFSITLHELAHGWAAMRLGDRTPAELGHMTANPLVHMGVWSLLMFALVGIAWGMMPTDPSRYRNGRRGRAWVAIAGPLTNAALAIIAIVIAGVLTGLFPSGGGPGWSPSASAAGLVDQIVLFLFIGAMLNIVLALFNLLPIPPLDGSQVLAGLSFRAGQFYRRPEIQQWGFIGLIVVFFVFNVGDVFFVAGIRLALGGVNGVADLFP